MNILNKMDHIYKIYEFLPLTDNSKHLILEPLSCVLKLALLQYKPVGTKISVVNNAIKFNEPSFLSDEFDLNAEKACNSGYYLQ